MSEAPEILTNPHLYLIKGEGNRDKLNIELLKRDFNPNSIDIISSLILPRVGDKKKLFYIFLMCGGEDLSKSTMAKIWKCSKTNISIILFWLEKGGLIRYENGKIIPFPLKHFEEQYNKRKNMHFKNMGITIFDKSIDELGLTVRSYNCLRAENINTIGELVLRTRENLLYTPNLGIRSVSEIQTVLEDMGLRLGMSIYETHPASNNKLEATPMQNEIESILNNSGKDQTEITNTLINILIRNTFYNFLSSAKSLMKNSDDKKQFMGYVKDLLIRKVSLDIDEYFRETFRK